MIDFLIAIQIILPVSMMVMVFINLKLALPLYLFYMVCIPYCNINLYGFSFGYNLLHIVFLFAFIIFHNKGKKISIRQLIPYIFFFVTTFIMMVFQDRISLEEQFDNWRVDMMLTLIVPFIIFNYESYDNELSNYLKWGLYIAMLVAGIYAVYLLTLPAGLNPYLMVMASLNGMEYKLSYSDDIQRALSRIFSTFSHPLTWSFFLSFFIIIFWNYNKTINKALYIFIMALSVFNITFCGVRTGLFAITIPIGYLIYKHFNKKLIIYTILTISVAYLIIENVSTMQDYIYSAFDNTKTTTKGSSVEMRLSQWEGCVDECAGRELIGNGYRWTDSYMRRNEFHPKAYCFESLIFVIYTNWGILGFFIWGIFFLLLARTFNNSFKNKSHISRMNAMLILYIVFSLLTGEYHYMRWFALFHAILYTYLKHIEARDLQVKPFKIFENETNNHSLLSSSIPSISRK